MKTRQKIRKGIILVSFFLFPATYYYFSPVLILEAASKGIINGSFIIFLLLFTGSLLLGRSFCGWVCPAAGCQESISPVRKKRVEKGNFIKWLIWMPWATTILVLAERAGGYHRTDFFYQTTHGFSIGKLDSLLVYLFVLIILIVLPTFLIGRRAFCHHLSWMSPFMIIGRTIRNYFNWRSLRLVAEPTVCKQCHTCTENCPMSLPVEDMVSRQQMESPECILCGSCVDGCKEGAIRYGWG